MLACPSYPTSGEGLIPKARTLQSAPAKEKTSHPSDTWCSFAHLCRGAGQGGGDLDVPLGGVPGRVRLA